MTDKHLTREQFATKFVDLLISRHNNANAFRDHMKDYDLGLGLIVHFLDHSDNRYRKTFEQMITYALPTEMDYQYWSVPDKTIDWFGPIHHSNFRKIDVFDEDQHIDTIFHSCIGNSDGYWKVAHAMCEWYDSGKISTDYLDFDF